MFATRSASGTKTEKPNFGLERRERDKAMAAKKAAAKASENQTDADARALGTTRTTD